MAPCIQAAGTFHRPLIQIHSGYKASWSDLHLSVETGAQGWTGTVRRHGRTLYAAERSSLSAAKTAAVEFALFSAPRATCLESPERVAGRLPWSEYW